MKTDIKEYEHGEGFTVKVRIYAGTNDSDDPTTCELESVSFDSVANWDYLATLGVTEGELPTSKDLEEWAFNEFLEENKR